MLPGTTDMPWGNGWIKLIQGVEKTVPKHPSINFLSFGVYPCHSYTLFHKKWHFCIWNNFCVKYKWKTFWRTTKKCNFKNLQYKPGLHYKMIKVRQELRYVQVGHDPFKISTVHKGNSPIFTYTFNTCLYFRVHLGGFRCEHYNRWNQELNKRSSRYDPKLGEASCVRYLGNGPWKVHFMWYIRD